MVVPCRHPQIRSCAVRRGSSTRGDMNLLQIWVDNGKNLKVNVVHNNNAEGSRKTSQGSFK